MAPEDLARLRLRLQSVALVLGEVLSELGRPVAHVLFPEAGMVFLFAVSLAGGNGSRSA